MSGSPLPQSRLPDRQTSGQSGMTRLILVVTVLALLLIVITRTSSTAMAIAAALIVTLAAVALLKRYLPEHHALSTLLFPGSGATFAQSAPTGTSGEVLISYHTYQTLHHRLKTATIIISLALALTLLGLKVLPVLAAAFMLPILSIAGAAAAWAIYSLLTLAPKGERVNALKALVRTDPRIAFARYAPTEQTGALKVGYTTYKRLYKAASLSLLALILLVALGLGREIYFARWSADQNFRAASEQFGVVLNSLTRGQGNLKEELAKLIAQSLQTAPGVDESSLTQRIVDQVTANLPAAPTEIVKETIETMTERTTVATATATSIQLEGTGQYIVKDNRGVTIFAFGPDNIITSTESSLFDIQGAWDIGGVRVTTDANDLNDLPELLDNTRFLVTQASDTLDQERILTAGAGITLTDGGANNAFTISANPSTLTLTTGTTDTDATPGSVFFAGVGGVIQQDNAHFFWDDTNNRLGIGTTSPDYDLTIEQPVHSGAKFQANSGVASLSLFSYRNSAVAHNDVYAAAARGTSSAPLPINADDPLLTIDADGWDGSSFSASGGDQSAAIQLSADENFTSNLNHGGKIVFSTLATGAGFKAPRMTIKSTGNVGIGTTVPTGTLAVSQAVTATGVLKGIVYTGAVNTNQTLSTEIPSLTLTTAGRQWATGALTTQREVLITQPTYSFVGASTITDAATVGIAGAPIKSTNATITNTHGLLIQAGAVSTATNSYGLTVNTQTGATNNYAAAFLGGNVGIGTTAPLAKLNVLDTVSTSPRGILSTQISDDTNGARVGFAKARGTVTTPTTVATGDTLGRLMFRGYDGTNYLEMASIETGVSGTVAATRVPTFMAFSTATDAAPSVLTERLRIISDGNVGIGTTIPNNTLHLSKANATGDVALQIQNFASSLNETSSIVFTNSVDPTVSSAVIKSIRTNSPASADTDLTFSLRRNGTLTDAVRMDSNGNIIVNHTSAGTSCVACLAIKSSTAPTASITDGIQLFAVDIAGSHELRVRDEAGNVTTLSPHTFSLFSPDQDYYLPWSYTSERDNQAINVDMYGAIQQIEYLSGEHFIYGKDLKSGDRFTPTNLAEILSVPAAFEELDVRFAALEERIATLESLSPASPREAERSGDKGTQEGVSSSDDPPENPPEPPLSGGNGLTLEELTNSDLDLHSLIIRTDVTVYGTLLADTLEIATALNLHGNATIWGSLLVKGDVELEANARVAGSLTRGNEETGHATIPAGSAWAKVRFTETLGAVPHVSITLVGGTAPYILSDVSREGFTLTLLENRGTDTSFTWVAITADKKSPEVETGGGFDAVDELHTGQEPVETTPSVVDTAEPTPPEATPVPPLPVESPTPAEAPPAAPV